jgi:hypothetical protein
MEGSKRANNVIRIPTSLKGSFFRIWVEFLTPLHNLTNKEKDVIAALIKARFELSKGISDEAILDRMVINDTEVKAKVKEEAGVSDAFYQVILGKLKKTNVIANGKIDPKFIPKRLEDGDSSFQLLLYFDLDARDN